MVHIDCVLHTHVNPDMYSVHMPCNVWRCRMFTEEGGLDLCCRWDFLKSSTLPILRFVMVRMDVRYWLYITGYYLWWVLGIMITARAACRDHVWWDDEITRSCYCIKNNWWDDGRNRTRFFGWEMTKYNKYNFYCTSNSRGCGEWYWDLVSVSQVAHALSFVVVV